MRLDFAPLLRLAGLRDSPEYLRAYGASCGPKYGSTLDTVAETLGITAREVDRYCRLGLNARQADRFATRIGVHPRAVWGEDYDRAEDQMLWWGTRTPPAGLVGVSPWVDDEPAGWFGGRREMLVDWTTEHTCATDGCRCPRAQKKARARVRRFGA